MLLATPAYQYFLVQGRRLEGQIALLDLAHRMQKHYAATYSYANATIATHSSTDVLQYPLTEQGWYRLTIAMQTDEQFALQAIPQGQQAQQDKRCLTLTLNHLGERGITSIDHGIMPSGPVVDCWKQ